MRKKDGIVFKVRTCTLRPYIPPAKIKGKFGGGGRYFGSSTSACTSEVANDDLNAIYVCSLTFNGLGILVVFVEW